MPQPLGFDLQLRPMRLLGNVHALDRQGQLAGKRFQQPNLVRVEDPWPAQLARSHRDARGLMQLIPQTAARFNVRNPFNATDNVRGGLAYLRWLLAYYQGQVALAAAAYNAGEAAVDRYRGVPPFPETRDYVKRVQRLFPRELHPYDAGVVAPSPILGDARPRPM